MTKDDSKWLFDETVQPGVDYTDKALAGGYDQHHEQFRDYEQEARKIYEDLKLTKDSVVLDIGCGTGGLAIPLARRCRQVYAVDASSAMVSILAHKVREQALGNVTPIQAGFLTYQHTGEAPDAVIASVTLHHLPDFWKQIALCKLNDILKTGGRLFLADVVFGFDPRQYREVIDRWLNDMKEIAGETIANEAVVHISKEFSTWDWVMAGMLERAGFHIDSCIEVREFMRSYICLK